MGCVGVYLYIYEYITVIKYINGVDLSIFETMKKKVSKSDYIERENNIIYTVHKNVIHFSIAIF